MPRREAFPFAAAMATGVTAFLFSRLGSIVGLASNNFIISFNK
jgi:hypothetical protein